MDSIYLLKSQSHAQTIDQLIERFFLFYVSMLLGKASCVGFRASLSEYRKDEGFKTEP